MHDFWHMDLTEAPGMFSRRLQENGGRLDKDIVRLGKGVTGRYIPIAPSSWLPLRKYMFYTIMVRASTCVGKLRRVHLL